MPAAHAPANGDVSTSDAIANFNGELLCQRRLRGGQALDGYKFSVSNGGHCTRSRAETTPEITDLHRDREQITRLSRD